MCPACGETRGAMLSEVKRMCFGCRHEWIPSETTGPVPGGKAAAGGESSSPAPLPLAAVPDLPEPSPLESARQRFVGSTVVVHELEVEGILSDILDDGDARVTFGSGFFVDVDPDAFSVVAYAPIEDEGARMLAVTNLSVIAQCLKAGAETIDETGGDRKPSLPPVGFLPPDPDVVMIVEQGIAYTVAVLAIEAGISKATLLAMAAGYEAAASNEKGTTEDDENGSSSDDRTGELAGTD
jgi:hypothetical protein